MKKKNQLYTLGLALLFTAAFPACTESENDPGNNPGGKILVSPSMGLNAWNDTSAPGTRADQTLNITLAEGGEISVMLQPMKSGNPEGDIQMNRYSVDAAGHLERIAYGGGSVASETEANLNIAAPGDYNLKVAGEAIAAMADGVKFRTYIGTATGGVTAAIAADGKLTIPCKLVSGGVRLNIKSNEGQAYAGADVTAILKGVTQYNSKPFEEKTLTAAAPSGLWGDIEPTSAITAGTTLMELTVADKVYDVKAPRAITFTAGRLYTFNVRVGATNIIVSSDDLSIPDFEVAGNTDVEAGPIMYNGQAPIILEITGGVPYYVAPVDAATTVAWTSIDFSTVCPEGWHVPTKAEFKEMFHITVADGSEDSAHDAEIDASVGMQHFWWTVDEVDADNAWYLVINSGSSAGVYSSIKSDNNREVRCVRKK